MFAVHDQTSENQPVMKEGRKEGRKASRIAGWLDEWGGTPTSNAEGPMHNLSRNGTYTGPACEAALETLSERRVGASMG